MNLSELEKFNILSLKINAFKTTWTHPRPLTDKGDYYRIDDLYIIPKTPLKFFNIIENHAYLLYHTGDRIELEIVKK